MANRDLTNFRQVTQQVTDTSGSFVDAGLDIATTILKQGQEAKITEATSQAQLDLSKLENQYRIENEANPMGGMEKYKKDRQSIFDSLGKGISPLYRRQWEANTRKIEGASDTTNQAWALKQTRVNTVQSVNTTMGNNFNQAGIDGQEFGLSSESTIDSLVNMVTSMESLEEFGRANLGEVTTENMMATYEEDYIKSFVSGVADNNPAKAVQLMESDLVRESFEDQLQFSKMKSSFEVKARRQANANKSAVKINNMKTSNSFMGEKLSYSDFQKVKEGMSPEVASFYEQVNGFSSQRKAVSAEEKVDLKEKFTILLSDTFVNKDVSDEDIAGLQNAVYGAMKKKVLTESEGLGYIGELIDPILGKQEESISQFESGNWSPRANLGLDSLNAEIATMQTSGKSNSSKLANKQMRVDMYDDYLDSLRASAKSHGTTVAGLTDKLSRKQEVEVYNKALNDAKVNRVRRHFPQFSGTETKKLPSTSVTPVASTPAVGSVSGGYKFIGGNPSKKSNWEKVN